MRIKKDDTVIVLAGKDKGKTGKVIKAMPKEGRVIVEGVNMVKKHVKPRRQGETGGIIEAEGALYACKAMIVCPKCDKGVKIGHKILDNGKKIRVCSKCGEEL